MLIVKNFGKVIHYQYKLIALFCFNIGQNSLNVLGPVCFAHFVPTGKAELAHNYNTYYAIFSLPFFQ